MIFEFIKWVLVTLAFIGGVAISAIFGNKIRGKVAAILRKIPLPFFVVVTATLIGCCVAAVMTQISGWITAIFGLLFALSLYILVIKWDGE